MENEKHTTDPLKKDAIYQGEDKFSPIPLSVSSPKINPIDKRLTKATAHETMQLQAYQQIGMLKKQAELIMQQVAEIEERITISKKIYQADLNFEPVVGTTYYVYAKGAKTILSLIAPNEWGKKMPYDAHNCTVKLLADKSWQVEK